MPTFTDFLGELEEDGKPYPDPGDYEIADLPDEVDRWERLAELDEIIRGDPDARDEYIGEYLFLKYEEYSPEYWEDVVDWYESD